MPTILKPCPEYKLESRLKSQPKPRLGPWLNPQLKLYAFLPILLLGLALTLAACSGGKPSELADIDIENDRAESGGKLFGDSFSFGGMGRNNTAVSGIAVNAFIWRAALDTIAFMPLNQVDPFGGVVITDWYSPANLSHERFKLNVYILSQELRADGLRVSAFKEIKNPDGQWETATVPKEFSLKIEDSILTRAREMRVAALESQN